MLSNAYLKDFKLPCKSWVRETLLKCITFSIVVKTVSSLLVLIVYYWCNLDEHVAAIIDFSINVLSIFLYMRICVYKCFYIHKTVNEYYNKCRKIIFLTVYLIVLQNISTVVIIKVVSKGCTYVYYLSSLTYIVVWLCIKVWPKLKGDSQTYTMYSKGTKGDLIKDDYIYSNGSFVIEYGDKPVFIDLESTQVYTLGDHKILLDTKESIDVIDWQEYAYIGIRKLNGSEDRWDYSKGAWHKIETVDK